MGTPSQRRHILMVITRADLGGAQGQVLALLTTLSQFQFTLATGGRGFLTEQAEALGIRVVYIDALTRAIAPRCDIAAFCQLKALLKRINPDLVHLHSTKAGVLGRLAAWHCGIPSLFTAHGWIFTPGVGRWQRSYGWAVEWLMGKLGQGIIAVSEYDYRLARQYGIGRAARVWVVQNGVEPPPPPPPIPIATATQSAAQSAAQSATQFAQSADCVLLTVGRMSKQKNQQLLLHALHQSPPNLRLSIVGDGPQRTALEAQAQALALPDRVQFVGGVDSARFFYQADIFVLSSDYEGLPLCILEAMSVGLPVVATDVGGVREAVVDGETGYLVPRGDAAQLAAKITYLTRHPERRQAFGQAARQHYVAHFQRQQMAAATAAVYAKVIGE